MEMLFKFLILMMLFFLIYSIINNRTYIEIFKFIVKPSFKKVVSGNMNMLATTLKISFIHISFALLLILLFTDELYSEMFGSFILGYEFVDLILIAPILEEVIFRYPLRRPLISLLFPVSSVLLKIKIYPLFLVLFVFQVFVGYLSSMKKVGMIRFFILNFKIYLFLSAIAFSMLHIKAIDLSSLIYVFLHFVSAIIFSWIRVKFNTYFAILSHSLYNLNLWLVVNLIEKFL